MVAEIALVVIGVFAVARLWFESQERVAALKYGSAGMQAKVEQLEKELKQLNNKQIQERLATLEVRAGVRMF